MAIRSDSYSSVTEVTAFTRHLLDGSLSYNSTTRPTVSEVEKFIDRASGVLNAAVATAGLKTPITNSTAKLACDDWVTARATEYVELTQRGTGFSEEEGNRLGFKNLFKNATQFVTELRGGFIQFGVTQTQAISTGLAFTGMDAQGQRDDPQDSTLEQPVFARRMFDDPTATGDTQ
jgi:hypothetical protein